MRGRQRSLRGRPLSLIGFRRTNVTEYDSSVISRLWKRVNKNGPVPSHRPDLGPCWLWFGTIDAYGYGVINIDRKVKQCHRVSFELAKGEIPVGLTVDHLCRVRPCLNPDHLESVSRGENVLRGNGYSGTNARKTECKRGHPLSGLNLYILPDGRQRRCRECGRESDRRRGKRPAKVVP